MKKRQVFYSFHYDNDVMRVQLVRNIGALDGNTPVSANEWEAIKRSGDKAIQNWIDGHMAYRSCVIVLVGKETANREWVKYEIEKAWKDRKGLFGIYIHNLSDPRTGTCAQGQNPFVQCSLSDGRKLSDVVKCYNPIVFDAYNDIKNHIANWIENAISDRA
jgi:hypothetical protein